MSGAGDRAVLAVEGLDVGTGHTPLLHDVSFAIGRGERVGLIGESGSGKSLTALAVMGLLGEGLHARGDVRLSGRTPATRNLLDVGEREMARLRGDAVSMVFQEPMTALNPTMRVGAQVAEVMRIHGTRDKAGARVRAVELLDQVGLPDPAHLARSYPHELSGGQRQRVVLAIALANDPALLICDEPTTALDVTVQATVLDLVVRGVQERDAAMLFITHDLAVVATVCERVLVMYGGRIVEAGPVGEVFTDPRHRYTQGLVGASDLAGEQGRRGRGALPTIPGTVPPAGRFPDGCVFRSRCGHATEECATLPGWTARAGAEEQQGSVPGEAGRAAGYACFHPAGDAA
ncbi:dipeptide/oligopeptide/nickel ABC transporter ATP-binding protein [Serinicoccus chungangensis]|uniref:Dipeptide/oligopeptide/nickel ABC transporter ATP-binding protein n=1 Tax=Serinicoccus chungangensis TaxID=767452 RepID=A0A0W8IEX2_9MICO|nr:ABC transporter ATP-binding protein [Serinicoccus chungangensis]KUG58440.1 dipeptide/oligopeptide/nickel ABC transporter ATP-binding protein [Serinicoccus chungangensis]